MSGLASGFIVGFGGELRFRNVWLDNSLTTDEPLGFLHLKEGGKAVFQNVEFSDGTCIKTGSSEAIKGNCLRINQRGTHDSCQRDIGGGSRYTYPCLSQTRNVYWEMGFIYQFFENIELRREIEVCFTVGDFPPCHFCPCAYFSEGCLP